MALNTGGVTVAQNANAKTSKRKTAASIHEVEALRMRAEGKSFAEIGEALGLTVSGVSRLLDRALDRVHEDIKEAAHRHVADQLVKIDRAEEFAARVVFGSSEEAEVKLKAIDRLVRLWERKSKLIGLDSPTRITATVEADRPTPAEIQLVAELATDAEAQAILAGDEDTLRQVLARVRAQKGSGQ